MQTRPYFVTKPTTHNKIMVTYGDKLELTEAQARPLINGGFICSDRHAATRILELTMEVEELQIKINDLNTELKNTQQTPVKTKEENK